MPASQRWTTWVNRAVPLADQVLSGVSNLLAIVLVARAMTADNFGRFALGFTVLNVTLSISRAYFGTKVSLAKKHRDARRLTADLTGSLVLVAPLVALLVMGISVATTGGEGLVILAAVAVATPVVLLQDILRFGSAAAGRPVIALVSDALWVLFMVVPFAIGYKPAPAVALGLWGVGAAVSALVAAFWLGVRPRARAGWQELRRRDKLGESLALGTIINNLGAVTVLLVVTSVIGPAAAGSLRGAASTMAPVNVLLAFAGISLTTTLARRPREGDRTFTLQTAAVMAGLVVLWGAVLLLLPEPAGRAAFGASWHGIRHVLPITVTEYIATTTAAGAILGLKVTNGVKELRTLRFYGGAVTLGAGTLVTVFTQDVRLVAATLSLSALVTACVAWRGWVLRLDRKQHLDERLDHPALARP